MSRRVAGLESGWIAGAAIQGSGRHCNVKNFAVIPLMLANLRAVDDVVAAIDCGCGSVKATVNTRNGIPAFPVRRGSARTRVRVQHVDPLNLRRDRPAGDFLKIIWDFGKIRNGLQQTKRHSVSWIGDDLPSAAGARVAETVEKVTLQSPQGQAGETLPDDPVGRSIDGSGGTASALATEEVAGNEASSLKTPANESGADRRPQGPELRMSETALSNDKKVPTVLEGGVIWDEAKPVPGVPSASAQAANAAIPAVAPIEASPIKPAPDRKPVKTSDLGDVRTVSAADSSEIRDKPDFTARTEGASAKMTVQVPSAAPVNGLAAPAAGPALSSRGEAATGVVDTAMEASAPVIDGQLQSGTERPRTEPSAARPIVSQVVQSIVRAPGDGLFEIRLQPEELGRVRLSITPTELGVTIQITAERHETLDLLRRHIDLLEADLQDQGFANLNFDFGPETSDEDPVSFEGGTTPDRQKTEREILGLDVELSQYTPQLANGRLDMRI